MIAVRYAQQQKYFHFFNILYEKNSRVAKWMTRSTTNFKKPFNGLQGFYINVKDNILVNLLVMVNLYPNFNIYLG